MNRYLKPWALSADEFPADASSSDQLEFLLNYAILAPSPLNTQPWLFRINVMDVELFADRRRALNVVDPAGRELTISCGAALANFRVAAEYFGHVYRIEFFPDPSNAALLARLSLGLQGETSGEDVLLFHAITQRRTNRLSFEDKPVPESLLGDLEAAARQYGAWFQVVGEETTRQSLAELVAEGDRRQWADKRFRAELAHWIRSKPQERADGLPVSLVGIKDWLAFAGPSLVRAFDRGGGQAAKDQEIALRSPVLAVLGTETDDAQSWLSAGQALQIILLKARTEEVWASFLNQPIEIPDLRSRLAETIGCGGCPHVLLRLGYGPVVAPTPRRSLREVLVAHKNVHS